MNIKNRKGQIRISKELIRDIDSNAELFLELFSHFVPIHIESNELLDTDCYYGYSQLFDEVELKQLSLIYDIPEYEVIVHTVSYPNRFKIDFKRK